MKNNCEKCRYSELFTNELKLGNKARELLYNQVKENYQLQKQNKNLIKALEWYADEVNYEWPECDDRMIIQDNGDTAREALKKIGE